MVIVMLSLLIFFNQLSPQASFRHAAGKLKSQAELTDYFENRDSKLGLFS